MILYHFHETSLSIDEVKTSDLITRLVLTEGFTISEVSVVFCSDDYLLGLNRTYLNHDYYTDILTFDYSNDGALVGELYISVDRVVENSILLNVSKNQELMRVLVHGFLHLCGYTDDTRSAKLEMTKKEDYYLSLVL